jgi:hypothetical protein
MASAAEHGSCFLCIAKAKRNATFAQSKGAPMSFIFASYIYPKELKSMQFNMDCPTEDTRAVQSGIPGILMLDRMLHSR